MMQFIKIRDRKKCDLKKFCNDFDFVKEIMLIGAYSLSHFFGSGANIHKKDFTSSPVYHQDRVQISHNLLESNKT